MRCVWVDVGVWADVGVCGGVGVGGGGWGCMQKCRYGAITDTHMHTIRKKEGLHSNSYLVIQEASQVPNRLKDSQLD